MATESISKIRGPRKDITGQKFGRWTVISFAGNSFWECRCECGAVSVLSGGHLKKGHSRSCGCLKAELSSQRLTAKLAGLRFGRLVVKTTTAERKRPNEQMWVCVCDCGNETIAPSNRLMSGRVKSCGCLWVDSITTHGYSRTRTYRIWVKMQQRCGNPNYKGVWENYGARGISVCARWREFENFIADMGEAPAWASIDRIDVNGNYEPGNCRWADRKGQSRNTRRNRYVEFEGERLVISDAIKILKSRAMKSG